MAYSPRRGAIYTHGKPPLPPSALKRSPTRKQAPYVQKIDVIDADTLRAVTDSLSSPPPDSLPPAVAVDQSFQPKSIAPPFPPPPPLCPAAPKFTSEPSTSPLKLPSREFVVRSSNQHVAREVVQAWDTMFTEALGADVVVSTDDGGSFPAHSHVLVCRLNCWCNETWRCRCVALLLTEKQHVRCRLQAPPCGKFSFSRSVPGDGAMLFSYQVYLVTLEKPSFDFSTRPGISACSPSPYSDRSAMFTLMLEARCFQCSATAYCCVPWVPGAKRKICGNMRCIYWCSRTRTAFQV